MAEPSALERLREMRRRLAYLLTRYGRDERYRSLLFGLRTRARSLDRCIDVERETAAAEARLSATEGIRGTAAAKIRGEARAARIRLNARLAAETDAFSHAMHLFEIRRATLEATQKSRRRPRSSRWV